MSKDIKLIETGSKSKVITFRVGESVYSALEKQAEVTGGTVAATARKLIMKSLEGEVMSYIAGDSLKLSTSGNSECVIMLVNGWTSEEEIKKRVSKLVPGAKEKEVS